MTKLPQKVYCVIDKKTGERVSQLYTRGGDAINKWKSWRCDTEHHIPVSFDLVNPTSLLDNLDD